MELTTIDMPRGDARRAFLEYREAVRERHSDEDAEIMRGYRELAQGRQLIRLSETIAAGGLDDQERPRLAVGPPDYERVWLECAASRDGSSLITYTPRPDPAPHAGIRSGVVKVNARFDHPAAPTRWNTRWQALVPIVPPRFRPARYTRKHFILWEAEWFTARAQAPVDPALIRHIGGDLWAVLAVWDLTEVEQSVLLRYR